MTIGTSTPSRAKRIAKGIEVSPKRYISFEQKVYTYQTKLIYLLLGVIKSVIQPEPKLIAPNSHFH